VDPELAVGGMLISPSYTRATAEGGSTIKNVRRKKILKNEMEQQGEKLN